MICRQLGPQHQKHQILSRVLLGVFFHSVTRKLIYNFYVMCFFPRFLVDILAVTIIRIKACSRMNTSCRFTKLKLIIKLHRIIQAVHQHWTHLRVQVQSTVVRFKEKRGEAWQANL